MPWQPTVGSKPLAPFHHQVAGQSSMLRYDKTTVCKPLIARENYVYKTLPAELAQFTPEYRGEIEVQLQEEDGYIQLYGLCVEEDDACTCTSSATINQTSDKDDIQSKVLNNQTSDKDDVQPKVVSREPSFKNRGAVRVLRSGSYEVNAPTNEVFYDADSTSDHPHTHSLNPWSLKNHKRLLDKMRKSEHSHDKIRFILLKNVVADFLHPCILDLKIGSRLHGDEASSKKVASQSAKCQQTTSSSLGVRLCGMQVYQVKSSAYNSMDKFHGRTLDKDSFRQMLYDFLHNGVWFRSELIKPIVVRLSELIQCLENLHSFRFYASSLLIIYDGDVALASREPEERQALKPVGQIVDFKESLLPLTVGQDIAQELNRSKHQVDNVNQEQSILEHQVIRENLQATSDKLSDSKAVNSCQSLGDLSSCVSLCTCDKSSQNENVQSTTLVDLRKEPLGESQVKTSCIQVRLNEKNNKGIRLVNSNVLVSEKSKQSSNNFIVTESSQESSTGLSNLNQYLMSQTPYPKNPLGQSSPGKTEHFPSSQETTETSRLNSSSSYQAALSFQPHHVPILTDSVETEPDSSGQVRAEGKATSGAHSTSCWCSVLTDMTPASGHAVTSAPGHAVTSAPGQVASTSKQPAVSSAHLSRHGSAKNGYTGPLLQGVSQVDLSVESGPADLAYSGHPAPEIHWGSPLSQTEMRQDVSVQARTNETLVCLLDSTSQSSAQQEKQKLQGSNTAALSYNQRDTKVDIKMIDFAHTTHSGFTEDKIKHTGPDKDYIHGLQNLKRLFQELLDRRN